MKKYQTIYADPPWLVDGRRDKNNPNSDSWLGLKHQYEQMETEDIKQLITLYPIAEQAHLYLWTTSNFLPQALEVMTAWGFKYLTNIVWIKTSGCGIGNYFRNYHEICLFGRKGTPLKIDRKVFIKSIIKAPRQGHSRKPQEMYDLIEKRSPGPYLELFARNIENPRHNWTYWGNEV